MAFQIMFRAGSEASSVTVERHAVKPPGFVIPAKAGIHLLLSKLPVLVMDPRFRGDDEIMVLLVLALIFASP